MWLDYNLKCPSPPRLRFFPFLNIFLLGSYHCHSCLVGSQFRILWQSFLVESQGSPWAQPLKVPDSFKFFVRPPEILLHYGQIQRWWNKMRSNSWTHDSAFYHGLNVSRAMVTAPPCCKIMQI